MSVLLPQAQGFESLGLRRVYTVHSGRVLFQESFWDHAEALEAMGLRG